MWNPFKQQPIEPRFIDVRKADITVWLTNGEKLKLVLCGEYLGPSPFPRGGDFIEKASTKFGRWQERAGETGMLSLVDGKFVPMHRVDEVRVEYFEHRIAVTDG